jgi:putative peptide zinc metalloprotease protein
LEAPLATGEVTIGSTAPEFELESVQGPIVRLSDYRAKVNVMLWFSRGFTCPFCRRYMAHLDQVYDKFRAANAAVLEVGPNALKPARTYFQRQPLKFPFLCYPSKIIFRQFGLRDLGPIEANKNTIVSFAYAYTHGDGLNTTRLSASDAFTAGVGRLHHHAFTAMQQGVFIVDRDGIVRYANVFRPLDTIPPIEEMLREVDRFNAGG